MSTLREKNRGLLVAPATPASVAAVSAAATGNELDADTSSTTQTLIDGTPVLVTGLEITFTVTAGKPVWVEAFLPAVSCTTNPASVRCSLVNGVDTTPIRSSFRSLAVAGNFSEMSVRERITAAGTYTRRLTLSRAGGTGTINNNVDAATVSSLRAIQA